jgi:hypothetical protein
MTIRDFIQLSILKPNKIWTILQNPLKKIKGIFFLLVLLVSIPGFIRAGKDIASMNTNLGIVAKQFPDLSIQDGKLSAGDNTGFVYRSDVFNIVFDPSGKSTDNDVTSESSQGIPSIGILQDHIVVDTIINTSKFSYEGLNGFSKENVQQFIKEFQSKMWLVFIGVLVFGFIYNTLMMYVLMILISFIVRLLTALFMRAYIQMHPTVSKQLTIAAMFLPATIYMVIGVLGIGGGVGMFMYLLVTSTFNWLLGMREFIAQQNKSQ